MKRKATLLILLMIMIMSLCGCGNKRPRIDVVTTYWRFDNTTINIGNDYEFVDFTKVFTDDGKCIITINFEK